jgi:hypothetical protein
MNLLYLYIKGDKTNCSINEESFTNCIQNFIQHSSFRFIPYIDLIVEDELCGSYHN